MQCMLDIFVKFINTFSVFKDIIIWDCDTEKKDLEDGYGKYDLINNTAQ